MAPLEAEPFPRLHRMMSDFLGLVFFCEGLTFYFDGFQKAASALIHSSLT
jgi:hypothetical protein